MKHILIAVSVVLSLALAPALAQSAASEKAKTPAAAASVKAAAPAANADAGIRVFIDPVTGQVRPPEPAEVQALSKAGKTNVMQPRLQRVRSRRRGVVGLRLDESFLSYSVATRNADGTVSFECVTGKQAADKAVANPVSKAAPKEAADVR